MEAGAHQREGDGRCGREQEREGEDQVGDPRENANRFKEEVTTKPATTDQRSISPLVSLAFARGFPASRCNTGAMPTPFAPPVSQDRKSTRLNSSHSQISYA